MNRRERKNKKRCLLKFGYFLYIGLCLFSIIWLRATVVHMEYEIGELDKHRADLTRERKMVVAQRANYLSSEKIEKLAYRNLGMTFSKRANVFYVNRTNTAGPLKASMR